MTRMVNPGLWPLNKDLVLAGVQVLGIPGFTFSFRPPGRLAGVKITWPSKAAREKGKVKSQEIPFTISNFLSRRQASRL